MNIENIVLELMDRIKTLESKVKVLEEKQNISIDTKEEPVVLNAGASITQRAKDYIMACKNEAIKLGNDNVVLKCNDIQKALGVSNRAPIVCHAMYDSMQPGDEVLSAPASGFSTTVTVQYLLKPISNTETNTMTIKQLKLAFEYYFKEKKPEYRHPDNLISMAFYIANNNIGVSFEDLFTSKVTLDQYGEILAKHFQELSPEYAKTRTSVYKDAMKNLLDFIHDKHYEHIKITE